MALLPGTRLGPYEVLAQLGVGGMGEVYRARDTTLGRDVALKILPDAFAQDTERLARFRREAQVLASLNHPHIAHLYGLEDRAGSHALVMELVEGPTLADRIAGTRGLPVAEALAIAAQIAAALEAAHQQGIIHRDLKPANIKVRRDGTVKVLDFGLAKAVGGADAPSDVTASPTVTVGGTREGVILGTAAYMSPEQARGQSLDRRTDIWAFGCVLLEMFTGRAPFAGQTISDTLAAILEREPDWAALPVTVPEAVRTLVRRCLDKNVRQRIADISVAKFVIDDLAAGGSASASGGAAALALPSPPPWRRMATASGAWLIGVAMASSAAWFATRSAAPPRVSRLLIAPPIAAAPSVGLLGHSLTLTPDGTRVVYVGADNTALFVRALDQLDATTLTGLGVPYGPFVSPDGQWIGFFDGVYSLKRIAITGGPAVTIGRPGGTAVGASWSDDGTIIFATNVKATGLMRMAEGGELTVLTRPNRAGGEDDHLWPEVLPGGKAVLFTITATTGGPGQDQVAVFDLQTGTQTVLIPGGSRARYVASGHLTYAAAGRLHAVAFDLSRLAVVGTPVAVQPEVPTDAGWAVAADGTLVYVSGSVSAVQRRLVWVDRQGQETSIAAAPRRDYAFPRLSPDGTRLALYIPDQDVDIWLWDLARATALRRVTFDPGADVFPVWRDDRHLIFSSARAGAVNLFMQAADGSGEVTQVTSSPDVQHATSVSPDGARLVFTETGATTGQDIMLLQLNDTHAVTPLVQTEYTERNGEVSPDGRWLAYEANDSGRFNIYVRRFPDVSSSYSQVSFDGGTRPLWARNGQELFYLSDTGALMRVGVAPGPTWDATAPTRLFEGDYRVGASQTGRTYDIAPDGRRFLMIKPVDAEGQTAVPTSLVVVQNWREELKRLVPTP